MSKADNSKASKPLLSPKGLHIFLLATFALSLATVYGINNSRKQHNDLMDAYYEATVLHNSLAIYDTSCNSLSSNTDWKSFFEVERAIPTAKDYQSERIILLDRITDRSTLNSVLGILDTQQFVETLDFVRMDGTISDGKELMTDVLSQI
jgi:hypothetical protein